MTLTEISDGLAVDVEQDQTAGMYSLIFHYTLRKDSSKVAKGRIRVNIVLMFL